MQRRIQVRQTLFQVLSHSLYCGICFFVNGQAVDMDSTSCRKTCKRFSKIAYLTNQNLDLSDTKEKDTEDATTSLGYLWLDRRPKTFQRTNLMNTSCSDHNLFELDICNKQVLKIPTCYTAHDTSLKKTKQKKPTVQSKLSKTK